MGGYGAFKLALLKKDCFAAAASMSGTPDISPMVYMAKQVPVMRKLLESTFGDLDTILGSENDLLHVMKELSKEKTNIPRLYLSSGRQDQGYSSILKRRDDIRSLGFDLTYEEMEGGHDWTFWDQGIRKVFDWLPIKREI
jgi:S-formylglutathione hydrolase FrmB